MFSLSSPVLLALASWLCWSSDRYPIVSRLPDGDSRQMAAVAIERGSVPLLGRNIALVPHRGIESGVRAAYDPHTRVIYYDPDIFDDTSLFHEYAHAVEDFTGVVIPHVHVQVWGMAMLQLIGFFRE
jgi:hypothetical protein